MTRPRRLHALLAFATAMTVSLSLTTPSRAADPWIVIKGGDGPGKGKHVVLVSGDEEYRSEEALPQLAKILAEAPRLQLHRPVRHRQGRDDRPQPARQHPRPRGPRRRPT